MQEKDARFVFASYRLIDENTKEEILRPFIVPERVNYKRILKVNPIFPSTIMYDGKKCKKHFFNEEWKSMRDDYVYLLAMLKEIDYAYGNKEILVDYRIRKTSVTGNKKKVIVPQWRVLREAEKVPFIKSIYYMCCWAGISALKYCK